MARRYGKVTVTGWIEQDTGHDAVVAWAREVGGSWRGEVLHANAAVEFLPEPVVFKDGDALRYPHMETLYVRSQGRWLYTGPSNPSNLNTSCGTDEDMARDLARGDCVRLVPEGATDAG